MDRSSFLKSLFVLAASPKMLAELKPTPKPGLDVGIIKDLKFVVPDYGVIPRFDPDGMLDFYDLTGNLIVGDMKTFRHFETPGPRTMEVITLKKKA